MNYGLSLVWREVCVLCALAGCTTNNLEPDSVPGASPAQAEGSLPSDTLTAAADALLRTAAKNSNSGTSQTIPVKILVGEGDTTRAIIKFDQAAIAAAVGSGTLTAASLELRVKESGTHPAGNDIDVHRVLKPWTEAGVTWKCGEDLNTGNVGADCPTTKWKMDGPDRDAFVATRTARVHLTSGQAGPARFDVTRDVQTFLAGGNNHGWLVNAGSATSRALLWSREAALKPALVLSVTEGDTTRPAVPSSFSEPLDTTVVVAAPADPAVIYYRNVFFLEFNDTTSGTTVRAVLQRYQATIVGGISSHWDSGAYVVRIADPGASWEAVQAVAGQMQSEPGVYLARPLTFRDKLIVRGRYPNDGAGNKRTDWFHSGPLGDTGPWQAVRAPLAWGCETGLYGTTKPPVAIVDVEFDLANPDLASSTFSVTEPSWPFVSSPELSQDPAFTRSHGTAVAGIIAAAGDNDQGIAGMVWGAQLSLFTISRSDLHIAQDLVVFYSKRVFPNAALAGARVLTSSLGVGSYTDESQVTQLRDALQRYLTVDLGNLFVLAAGDNVPRATIAQLANGQAAHPGVTALDRAAAQLHALFPKQILFVAGTDRGGVLTSSSNLWTGAVRIAAPAVDIKSLGRVSDHPSGTISGISGTSFAAPFVAGVAAQLWAMDPSLRATEVSDYLVGGARLARISSTGADSLPPTVGVPDVYQLDAYGALSLLSRDRPGTPICGFPVTLELPQSGPRVRLARNGSNAETIATPGNNVDGLSVAQGGRLFAIGKSTFAEDGSSVDLEVDEFALANGQWSVRRSIADVGVRTYLEKDTLDSDNISGVYGTWWTLRGSRWGSQGTTMRLAEKTQPYLTPQSTPFYPYTYPYTLTAEFSQDGAYAVVRTRLESPPCPNYQDQMWLVTLPNGPVQALLPTQCNNEGPRDAAWDPTGSRFILADIGANGVTYRPYRIVSGAAQTDGTGVTIPDRFPTDYSLGAGGHSTDPSGTTATWLELVDNGCYLTTRTTGTFALVSEQLYPYSNPDWLGFCQVPVQMLRMRPGSRVSLRR